MFQVVKEPRWNSLQKLRDAASERARYSDYSVRLSDFNDVPAELLEKEEAIYHLECDKLATNKNLYRSFEETSGSSTKSVTLCGLINTG